ncbi:nucleotide exchange factor GrpE [Pelagibacteraceae bacterium]|nr:nucleotide exchange factor GrpE [Pelagibacteraceae bacterium]
MSEEKIKDSEIQQEKVDPILEEKEEKKEISLEKKLAETEDKLLRSLAEVENQRRRFEKEIKDAFEFGFFNFAKESLSILDNLQRAKLAIKNDETLKKSQELDKFLENITIIEKDLISIFEKNRIKKIITQNQKFDPNLHQAMSEIEDEQSKTGSILQEIQPGYMLGERLLRPALVAVAKRKISENDEKIEKKDNK